MAARLLGKESFRPAGCRKGVRRAGLHPAYRPGIEACCNLALTAIPRQKGGIAG